MGKRLSLGLLFAFMLPSRAWGAVASPPSRIYVTAVTCSVDSKGRPVTISVAPSVTLFDLALVGDNAYKGFSPQITVTSSSSNEVHLQFDAKAGAYDAFLRFPNLSRVGIGTNGPLIVISGYDRHLVVSACNSITDWHASSVIAGESPLDDVSVSVIVFDHPMACGSRFRALNQQTDQPMFKFRIWN